MSDRTLFDPPARTATELNIRHQALRAQKVRRRRQWVRACNNYDRDLQLVPRGQVALVVSFAGTCRRIGDLDMARLCLSGNGRLRRHPKWARLP